jgi:hypothetical protein
MRLEEGGVTPPLASLDLSTGPIIDHSEALPETAAIQAPQSANIEVAGHFAHHLKFDPQRRAQSEEMKAAVASVTTLLAQHDQANRKRARTAAHQKGFLLAIEAMVCNLAFLNMPGMPCDRLSVPRSNVVMRGRKRYRSPVYGQHFIDALDLMLHPEVSLIEQVERGYHFARGPKQQGTVRPTAAFLQMVPTSHWDAFSRAEEYQPLILMGRKDRETGKAERINYADTGPTRRLRKQVKRINAYLSEAPLTIVMDEEGDPPMAHVPPGPEVRWRSPLPVDFTQRTVWRTFNNGSWQEGGRLYGGFWETMHRPDRFRYLRIDGERIANVDFGQLYLRLAYLHLDLTPPEGDLYAIQGYEDCREGLKAMANALLFADRPFRHWPHGRSALFPKGTVLRDVTDAIQVKHMPIISLFEIGIGHRLSFTESSILIDVVLRLFGQGITALPLHDSVLVAQSKAELAKAEMERSIQMFMGSFGREALPIKIDFGLP